jgi:hypothetical protein
MNLIDAARCDYLYNALPAKRTETSGGSAGNSIAGLKSLGARAAFSAKWPTMRWAHPMSPTCSASASTSSARR